MTPYGSRIVCAVTAIALASAVRAFDEEDVLFYAPFDGKTQAVVAAGRNLAVLEGQERYEPGKRGQALVCGEAGAVCRFETAGNLLAERGTVEMWVKAVDWEPAERKFHVFFETEPPGWLLLYRYWEGGLLFLTAADRAKYTAASAAVEGWRRNEWCHLAATWKPGEVKVYLNGEPQARLTECSVPTQVGPYFLLGDRPWQIAREGGRRTLLDEVYIYKRPLTDTEIRRAYGRLANVELKGYEAPRLTIPRCAKPPQVDGQLDPQEWRGAAGITGFISAASDELANRQAQVRLTYDADCLYLAFDSTLPGGGVPRATVKTRDGEVWTDDAVEVFLAPRNTDYFQFIVNPAGTVYDAIGSRSTWDGQWSVRSQVSGSRWTAELSIPFATLGTQTPANGEQWRVNFCRDWQDPQEWTAWSGSHNFHDVSRFGTVTFADSAPGFAVESLGRLWSGDVAFSATFANAAATPLTVLCEVEANSRHGRCFQQAPRVELQPGATTSVTAAGQIEDKEADMLMLRFSDPAGSRVWYQGFLPFSLRPPIEVRVAPIPSRGVCEVTADIGGMRTIPTKPAAFAELKRPDAADVLQRRDLGPFAKDVAHGEVDLAALPTGDYEVRVTVTGADRQVLATDTARFTKPPREEWREAHAGVSDTVLPPWTPLAITETDAGVTASCWGREYQFVDSALPRQIVTRGAAILAQPPRIVASANEAPVTWSAARPAVLSRSATAAVLRSTATGGPLRLTIETRIEYDGLLVTRLTLEPNGPVRIGRLAIEIPLNADNAKYMHVPAWNATETGAVGTEDGWSWSRPFMHYMWLGDEDRGLCWFAELNEGRRLQDQAKAVALTHSGREVVLRLSVIDAAFALDQPLRLEFGFQATPVKPLPKGWRSWGLGRNIYIDWTAPSTTRHFGYPEAPDPERYRQRVAATHAVHQAFVPYSIISMLSANSPEWRYYGADWAQTGMMDNASSDVLAFGCPIMGVCPASREWVDCITSKNQHFVETYGLDGLYHDFSSPRLCRNTNHGCPAEGRMPILAWRELYKRIYTILKSQKRETFMVAHMSGALCIPILSFSDVYVDAENIRPESGDYLTVLPLEKFKAEFMGRQWGLVPAFLPEFREPYVTPEYTERLLSLLLLHDAPTLWMAWCHTATVTKVWKALDEFGAAEADFLPCWSPTPGAKVIAVTPTPASFPPPVPVAVSAYLKAGKSALLVVSNLSTEDVTARLQLDPKALGLGDAAVPARDAFSSAVLAMPDGLIEVPVPARRFRLLRVGE